MMVLYFFVKEKKTTYDNSGQGSVSKEFILKEKQTNLNLSYEFYTDEDELEIYDQNNKILFNSSMKSTSKEQKETIALKNVTKITIKITSKVPNSRWSFSYITY